LIGFIAQGIEFNQKIGFKQEMGNFLLWVKQPFNVVRHSMFIEAMKVTFEFRTYYKPSSYHGLLTGLLKQSKVNVSKQITKRTRNSIHKYGATICFDGWCRNPKIGFASKCEVQRPMGPRVCLGVKHTFPNGGECKGWSPMIPNVLQLWELHLCKSCECLEPWLKRQTNTKLSPQDTIKKVLKHKCLKCSRIIHLDLICMSCDKKTGARVKLKIWLSTTNP